MKCPICGCLVDGSKEGRELHGKYHLDKEESTFPISILRERSGYFNEEFDKDCQVDFCREDASWQYNEVRCCHYHLFETDGYL